jgi:hypothetical protein
LIIESNNEIFINSNEDYVEEQITVDL